MIRRSIAILLVASLGVSPLLCCCLVSGYRADAPQTASRAELSHRCCPTQQAPSGCPRSKEAPACECSQTLAVAAESSAPRAVPAEPMAIPVPPAAMSFWSTPDHTSPWHFTRCASLASVNGFQTESLHALRCLFT